jgi:hypothetical protein
MTPVWSDLAHLAELVNVKNKKRRSSGDQEEVARAAARLACGSHSSGCLMTRVKLNGVLGTGSKEYWWAATNSGWLGLACKDTFCCRFLPEAQNCRAWDLNPMHCLFGVSGLTAITRDGGI